MKKSIFLGLVLAALAVGEVVAESGKEWYNSYAPALEGDTLLINAGVGYGLLPQSQKIPPLSASVEYMLSDIPLSVGGYAGYTTYSGGGYTGTMIGLGGRAAWHFNFAESLDVYAALNVGYLIWNEEYEYLTSSGYPTYRWETSKTKTTKSTFLYGGCLGARYFFTDTIGAYIELGYSAISVASLGLTVKL